MERRKKQELEKRKKQEKEEEADRDRKKRQKQEDKEREEFEKSLMEKKVDSYYKGFASKLTRNDSSDYISSSESDSDSSSDDDSVFPMRSKDKKNSYEVKELTSKINELQKKMLEMELRLKRTEQENKLMAKVLVNRR